MRTLIKGVLLVLIPLGSGWFGFALSFSDRGPGESMLERSALILGMQMFGGAVVGFLLPRHWYVSVAAAWGSLFWVVLRPTAVLEAPAIQFPEDRIHPPWVPFAALLLTIALGYVASRVRTIARPFRDERERSDGKR
jgi:hypothetical protein